MNRKRQARRRQTPQWLVIFIVFIVFAVLKISGGDTFESPVEVPIRLTIYRLQLRSMIGPFILSMLARLTVF